MHCTVIIISTLEVGPWLYVRPECSLRSSGGRLFVISRSRLKTKGHRAFGVRAPQLWIELPEEIRQGSSVSFFKSILKTYFFLCFIFDFVFNVFFPVTLTSFVLSLCDLYRCLSFIYNLSCFYVTLCEEMKADWWLAPFYLLSSLHYSLKRRNKLLFAKHKVILSLW